jgi:hypothetical protein
MADYVVTCSCGHEASRPTLGQAAAEFIRHVEEQGASGHAVVIQRRLPAQTFHPPRGVRVSA